jgi:signal transduction histidine kinase/CheY-like chemotaxis protein
MIFAVLPAAASANNEHETVRVGYYENEVFQEGAEDGAVKTGYAYEYYQKLSEYTGWRYTYVYGDFNELYQMLRDGEIDLLAGLAWREDREELIGYPDAVMGNESYYLVKHNEDNNITANPASLNGSTIGVLDSAMVSVLNQYLDDHGITATLVTYPNHTQLFSAFDSHAVDILAAESDGAHGREHAEVISVFGTSDYYLCVNKNRPDLLAELNTAQTLLATSEPSYLSTLRAKYYSVSFTAHAFSQAERRWLDSHTSLHVGYLENYLPFSDTDKQGSVNGAVKDIVPAILDAIRRPDIGVTYSGYKSYDDMITAINTGEIDVAFPVGGGLYYSEENGIYQSNTVSAAPAELVYRGEFSEKTTEHFAVNENNRMQYYFVRTNYPDAEITFCHSIDECLSAVLSGKAGCATMNGLRANDILRNRKYNALSHRQTSYIDSRCFGVEIGNEGLLRLLNRGISILGVEYTQNLLHRYNDGLFTYSFADMLRDHMALFASIILAIAAFIIFLLVRDSRRTKQEVREKETSRLELEEKNRKLAESQQALSDALIAAEHANNAKTTFLNSMSHDIRTPMNAIVGFTALAASHMDNKEQVKDYLSKISVSSQHLLSLINDVLDMSRIESGKMTIEETNVHLPDVIHDLRTIIQSNISSKQMELFIDTQDVTHEDIITDKLRLNQVLLNILTNAIKFTPAGGTISFRVIEKPSPSPKLTSFEFRIKDNGIGMSKEFQKTIFEAFARERTSTVSGIQGTGLGMAITKNIVDMMGGTIDVISEEGKGSEFVVIIPCKISDVCTKFEPIPELKGVRALVADDDTNTCLSICSMLREIGMRPDWTNYGKEAVVRTKEALDQADEFRVYIIDWMIPDQNGIETVRRIRKVIGSNAPIIILTAYDWADIEEEAREAGVTAFCSKPLFMSEMRNVLTQPFMSAQEPQAKGNEPEILPNFSGKRVLLVEDNYVNQMIAETVLTEANLCVEIANDGTEAVEMVKAAPAGYFDIILMDIQMPKMDGYEATKLIRALEDKEKAGIPIIAVTANAFEEDRRAALEAGMNGHLAKPYDIPAMLGTLTALLK